MPAGRLLKVCVVVGALIVTSVQLGLSDFLYSSVYAVTGEPPSVAGACQLTVRVPGAASLTETACGADGAVIGAPGPLTVNVSGVLLSLVPVLFVALTRTS